MIEVHYRDDGDCTIVRLKNDYEGEDRVEHSMLIHEDDIDDLIDVLDRYIEKRGGK